MKKQLISALFIIATALISGTCSADELDEAMYDLNRGKFKAAIAKLEPLVELGYSPAQYQMGLLYKNGQGKPKNTKMAFDLFTLSAKQHNPDAQFDLAVMYSEGTAVAINLKKAFSLTELAANKELASAQFNLGVMYANGKGTKQDYFKASRYYKLAANQNYALAQFNLALLYFNGQGVEKSTEMSLVWNSISAENGYGAAEKSRDMDLHKLTSTQVKSAQEKAQEISTNITERLERKAQRLSK
ncbi:MAG: sel1 repeat family protein [Alteromonadaceae bacterium]|nr:sel1 repeat family protein [Alteromonadaceae bacterium]